MKLVILIWIDAQQQSVKSICNQTLKLQVQHFDNRIGNTHWVSIIKQVLWRDPMTHYR